MKKLFGNEAPGNDAFLQLVKEGRNQGQDWDEASETKKLELLSERIDTSDFPANLRRKLFTLSEVKLLATPVLAYYIKLLKEVKLLIVENRLITLENKATPEAREVIQKLLIKIDEVRRVMRNSGLEKATDIF